MAGIKTGLSILFMCTIAVSYAQPGGECSETLRSFCPLTQSGEQVPCLARPLPPSAPADEPNYVCNCTLIGNIGFDCGSQHDDIGHGSYGFITCYGRDCASGSFESLDYPNSYPNRWKATYLLYIPGASRINFQFVGSSGFSVENFKDTLYVGEGLLYTKDLIDAANEPGNNTVNGIEVYCFDNRVLQESQPVPEPFTLFTDTVWLYFKTDKSLNHFGWRLQWTSEVDNTPPLIDQCPSGREVVVEFGMTAGVVITWNEPTADDPSIPLSSNQSHSPGDLFFVGTTEVTYTFSDRFGNSDTCSFTVTINDVQCPDEVRATLEPGVSNTSVFWTEPIGSALVNKSHASGSVFLVGETEVTYTFTEQVSGEQLNACSFLVIVTVNVTDPCSSNPCQNGATCFAGQGQNISCNCSEGFTGDLCDMVTDPCNSNPCQNGATCAAGQGQSITCSCSEGFTGDLCDMVMITDPCNSNPCQNGATCAAGQGQSISCSCSEGFTGDLCDMEVMETRFSAAYLAVVVVIPVLLLFIVVVIIFRRYQQKKPPTDAFSDHPVGDLALTESSGDTESNQS